MRCNRCGGLQLWSHFANLGSAVGAWAYDGWRCMNCGDVVDALILENRSLQQEFVSTAHRARPFAGQVVWIRSPQNMAEDHTRAVRRTSRLVQSDGKSHRQAA